MGTESRCCGELANTKTLLLLRGLVGAKKQAATLIKRLSLLARGQGEVRYFFKRGWGQENTLLIRRHTRSVHIPETLFENGPEDAGIPRIILPPGSSHALECLQ